MNIRRLSTFIFPFFLFILLHPSTQGASYEAPDNTKIRRDLIQKLITSQDIIISDNATEATKVGAIRTKLAQIQRIPSIRGLKYNLAHLACETDDIKLLNLLITCNATKNFFNQKDTHGWAPLHYAAWYNAHIIVTQLLGLGKKKMIPNSRIAKQKITPLILAAYKQNEKTLKVFTQYQSSYIKTGGSKLQISAKDSYGKSASDYYRGNDKEILTFLGTKDPNYTPSTKRRRTPYTKPKKRRRSSSNITKDKTDLIQDTTSLTGLSPISSEEMLSASDTEIYPYNICQDKTEKNTTLGGSSTLFSCFSPLNVIIIIFIMCLAVTTLVLAIT